MRLRFRFRRRMRFFFHFPRICDKQSNQSRADKYKHTKSIKATPSGSAAKQRTSTHHAATRAHVEQELHETKCHPTTSPAHDALDNTEHEAVHKRDYAQHMPLQTHTSQLQR
eukprot:TRINITY_DN7403_c0_g1_i1.p2 TRINITY_DN7403_c0_g1~~TRINITY_DN7403_c0_g1_i1.p2  ORF type:complete len:112 (-),score=7.88 TRINITY_DN7403_c0_g1_i1:108-443(-)